MNQAKLYSKSNGLQKFDANYVIENFSRLIKWKCDGNDNILDIGCGDGDVLLELLMKKIPKNFQRLIGTDISPEMIEFARKRNDNPRIQFEIMDIAADKIPEKFDEEFDHIFSFYCLHWVEQQNQAMKNIFDMLKPGGDMLLSFIATNPIYDIYENMANSGKWARYMDNLNKYISPYHHSKNPEIELGKILHNQGFINHLCRVENRTYSFENFAILQKALHAVNPFIKKIPENEIPDFIDEYLEQVRQLDNVKIEKHFSNNNEEERIIVPYKIFIIFASKPI